MSDNSIDQLIFLLSTDFFEKSLFSGAPKNDVKKIKSISRSMVSSIVEDGDNYYVCGDFSNSRFKETEDEFFNKISISGLSLDTGLRINMYYKKVKNKNSSENLVDAINEIIDVSSNLYWLVSDYFQEPITDEILEIMSIIEPIGLAYDSVTFSEGEWLNSSS